MTCDRCAMQYVGETVQKLSRRQAAHRTGLDGTTGCRIMLEHFSKGVCKGAGYTVKILEKLDGTGRTEHGSMELSSRRVRRARECHWMLKLRTVYPFGLNERIGDEFKSEDKVSLISPKFPRLDRQFVRGTQGNHLNKKKSISAESFLDQLHNVLTSDIKEAMNFLRTSLYSLNKKVLKNIFVLTEDLILNVESNPFGQWYLAMHDIIVSKLYAQPPQNQDKQKIYNSENLLNIHFVNKGIEMINLPKILHNATLPSCFPKEAGSYSVPTVTYKLNDTIHSSIFNYNKFISNLDLDAFIQDPTILPCECSTSLFMDDFHKHIICGDLSIVQNKDLQKLFQKGPQYREPVTIDLEAAKKEIIMKSKLLVKKWSTIKKTNITKFDDWLGTFTALLQKRIEDLNKSLIIRPCTSLLQQYSVKNSLKSLHSKFVITPIDKASNNVAFICKRYYAQVLVDELGISNSSNPNPTYVKIANGNKDNIIKKQVKNMKTRFKIVVDDDDMKVLPSMHWTPKKHKIPSKARFIVAAKKCSLKKLAQTVTKVLKMFYKQIENYNKKSHFFSHVKTFWIIQNKDPVITAIKKLNDRNKAKSIATFDFSTLYTKIPHTKLKYVLNELTDFCFNGCITSKIVIHKNEARWCHSSNSNLNKDKIQLDKDHVKDAIAYLLDNCFFSIGDNVFKQVIGIPMGSDPAPFMANLFLYYYESKFLKEYKNTNPAKASKFNNVFRFIDDLCAINDDEEFEKNIIKIYPVELELKKENIGYEEATFLDLNINTKNKKFAIKLYDKRDDFNFTIVRMPFLSNNMPSRIFYSSFSSELLRIARCTTAKNDFLSSCRILIKRMFSQGAEGNNKTHMLSRTRNTIHNVFKKHTSSFSPFFETAKLFSSNVLLHIT